MIKPLQVLKELDFERLAGSENEEKARNIIKKYLDEAGIPYVEEPFSLWSFDSGKATLKIDDKEYSAMPFGLSDSGSFEGELCFVRNADEIIYNKGIWSGKIILASNITRNAMLAMKEENVAGMIRVSPPYRTETSLSYRQQSKIDGSVPAVTVTYNTAEKLIGKSGSQIKMTIEQSCEERTAYNIIATIGKSVADNTLTYMVAHYDTVARSHGSTDNAGGSVCILRTAEKLHKLNLQRELKVCFFSGEELGLLGSSAYVEAHKEEIQERAGLVLNVDVAGDVLGTDMMAVIGTQQLMGYANGMMKENGYLFNERLDIYSSDGIPFSVYEIPSINIARFGGKGTFHIHTENDVAKHCTAQGLNYYVETSFILMQRILTASIYPVKKEIDGLLRERIEKYLWNSRQVKPELNWTPNYKK